LGKKGLLYTGVPFCTVLKLHSYNFLSERKGSLIQKGLLNTGKYGNTFSILKILLVHQYTRLTAGLIIQSQRRIVQSQSNDTPLYPRNTDKSIEPTKPQNVTVSQFALEKKTALKM